MRQATAALKAELRPQARSGPFRVYRAAIHLHSAFSHDSRGTLDEIVAAAKATGTHVLMFSEHPSDRYDPCLNGHQGFHDSVLVIPGVETKGFVVFPTRGLRDLKADSPQAYSDRIRDQGGLVFLSHLEERMDWEIQGLTGVEIYNTHADFKDETKLVAALRNPFSLATAIDSFRKYPQEAFSALQDYPADYLRRWDELCMRASHTGVAANDSHQNTGLAVRLIEGEKVRVEDALGKKLLEAPLMLMPFLQPRGKDKKPGDPLMRLQLDPYENSLRHVGIEPAGGLGGAASRPRLRRVRLDCRSVGVRFRRRCRFKPPRDGQPTTLAKEPGTARPGAAGRPLETVSQRHGLAPVRGPVARDARDRARQLPRRGVARRGR